MPIREVGVSEFKAKCAHLLKRAQRTKQMVRVTRYGRTLVFVTPSAPQPDRTDWIGSMMGKIQILGNIISPAKRWG
jgi:prevent-host-death family protein